MYKVLAAELVPHAQRDNVEDALNVAAEYVKTHSNTVALVKEDGTEEAVTVIAEGFAYVAAPPES